ncbi:MAG: hypothetical protein WBE79_09135 [Candidatus Cybelea sp.]
MYTYDVGDEPDCTRVRVALSELGVTWKIPYKTDADIYAGRYSSAGGALANGMMIEAGPPY